MIKKLGSGLIAIVLVIVVAATLANYVFPLRTAKFLGDMARNNAGFTVRTIDIDGKSYPYSQGGSGTPLVLVHGFGANKDSWIPIGGFLTPHYTVYVPDLPGFGGTDRDPTADYSIEAQAKYLHQFIKALGLTKFHLGGSSMGGGIAAIYTALYPDEVESLWLLDAAATQDILDSPLMNKYKETGAFPLLVSNYEQLDEMFKMLFVKVPFLPHAVQYAFLKSGQRDRDFNELILKQLINTSKGIETLYSHLHTPTFIVTGEQDQIVPPHSVHTLAKVFTNSQIKIMPALGHIPQNEDPKTTASDYLTFRSALK